MSRQMYVSYSTRIFKTTTSPSKVLECMVCGLPGSESSSELEVHIPPPDSNTTISLEASTPMTTRIRSKDISVAHINIRGLVNYLIEIKVLLYNTPVDFPAVTETYLNADITENEILIDSHKVIHKDRPNGSPWEGSAIY